MLKLKKQFSSSQFISKSEKISRLVKLSSPNILNYLSKYFDFVYLWNIFEFTYKSKNLCNQVISKSSPLYSNTNYVCIDICGLFPPKWPNRLGFFCQFSIGQEIFFARSSGSGIRFLKESVKIYFRAIFQLFNTKYTRQKQQVVNKTNEVLNLGSQWESQTNLAKINSNFL